MGDRLLPGQRIDIRRQRIAREVLHALKPAHDPLRIVAVKVDLGPVARRQNRGFLDLAGAGQVTQRVGQRVRRERNPLAHRERGGRVVEAECMERHDRATREGEFYPITCPGKPPAGGLFPPCGLISIKSAAIRGPEAAIVENYRAELVFWALPPDLTAFSVCCARSRCCWSVGSVDDAKFLMSASFADFPSDWKSFTSFL